jgi:hypothetical protein
MQVSLLESTLHERQFRLSAEFIFVLTNALNQNGEPPKLLVFILSAAVSCVVQDIV